MRCTISYNIRKVYAISMHAEEFLMVIHSRRFSTKTEKILEPNQNRVLRNPRSPLLSNWTPSTLHKERFYSDLQIFKPRQNRSRNLENMVMSYFHWMRLGCGNERFFTTENQKKNDCFNANEFCRRWNTVFDQGLFLSLLFLSRVTACFNWRRQSMWNKTMGLD